MDPQTSRSGRLASLVAQARVLLDLACPTSAYQPRVLDVLTPDEVEELRKREPDRLKSEGILNRLSA